MTRRISAWLSGGGFPVFALTLLAAYELGLLFLLTYPAQGTGLEAFAEDFRVWCYGYDPATGTYELAYIMSMLVPPLMMGGLVALLWSEPLRDLRSGPTAQLPSALLALVLVGAGGAGMVASAGPSQQGELPFPAEALRTSHRPPELALVDQVGNPLDLQSARGNVVVLTAVYAHCTHTCPVILTQVKNALAELTEDEQAEVRVIGVTLDPERDDPASLAQLMTRHGFESPTVRLATGDTIEVNRILDEMGVARSQDPDTGVIDHANILLLIDREGQVAYRLTIGERQERWMVTALRLLLAEGRDLG